MMNTLDTPDNYEAPSGRPRNRTFMALALLAAGLVGCGEPGIQQSYNDCLSDAHFALDRAGDDCQVRSDGAQSLCEISATQAFNRELNACIQEIHADDEDCTGVGMNENDSDGDGIPNDTEIFLGSDMCDPEDTGRSARR